jgi:hypothetical protein
MVKVFMQEKVGSKIAFLMAQANFEPTFSCINTLTIRQPCYYSSYLPTYEDGTDSVPKRRHSKFRRRGITQKKTYNIHNTAEV